jgi:succinate-acetate transporter protein
MHAIPVIFAVVAILALLLTIAAQMGKPTLTFAVGLLAILVAIQAAMVAFR